MFFKNPVMFFLLLLVVGIFLYDRFVNAKKNKTGLRFSSNKLFDGIETSLKTRLSGYSVVVRVLALTFIVVALARPVSPIADSKIETEGIDIVLAIDCSTSMYAEDFTLAGKRYNRLDIVKMVVADFIKARRNDRIGIVAFASRAYTICPMTLDYSWLIENLKRIEIGMIEDGTAIGLGLSSALSRLGQTKTKEKVVILLTDGQNNTGNISPVTAGDAARALGIKVYTIGAGTKGLAPYPARDFFGNIVYQNIKVEIDEDLLREISNKTGGKYFRATDTESLKKIYQEIDKMEKTPLDQSGYLEYKELFPMFLYVGMILLICEVVLWNTIFRTIP